MQLPAFLDQRHLALKVCLSISIFAMLLASSIGVPVSGLEFVTSINLKTGENNALSSVIDTVHDAAYYGTSTGRVAKVQLSTFTETSSISLSSGLDLKTAVLDFQNQFAYFGSDDAVPSITKVNLATFTESAVIKDSSLKPLSSAVIDSTNHYAYFGSANSGIVYRVNLSNFVLTSVTSLNLPAGTGPLTSAVIQGHHAYFGTDSNPGTIVRVDLNNFAIGGVATLNLNNGESGLLSAVVDEINNAAYFATNTSPGIIAKIDLFSFTHPTSLSLAMGENAVHSATNDTFRRLMYFGTSNSIVVEVNMTTLVETSKATVASTTVDLASAVLDPSNVYAYFGSLTSPGQVFKLDLRPLAPPVGGVTFPIDRVMLVAKYVLLPGLVIAGILFGTVAIVLHRRKHLEKTISAT